MVESQSSMMKHKRRHAPTLALFFVALLSSAPAATGTPEAAVQSKLAEGELLLAAAHGDLAGDGSTMVAALIRGADGRWRMAVLLATDGAERWREAVVGALDRTPRPDKGSVRYESLGKGRAIFDFSVPLEDSLRSVRRVVGWRDGAVAVLYTGVTGAEEHEYGTRVELTDLRGTGTREIIVSEIGDAPRLCDGTPGRVHPRIYRWETGKLELVSINPGVEGLPTITAKAEGPPAATGLGALSPLIFTAASSSPGYGGSARAVAAPRALGDGRPDTVWIEGEPRFGQGAFVLARVESARPIHALRIVAGHGGGKKEWKRHNRLAEVVLVLGDGTKGERLLVEIPDSKVPTVSRVDLPEPVDARCLALIIRAVHPGRDHSATAIAEITALSDLDLAPVAERIPALLEDLRAGGARGAASRASLSALGGPAAVALAKELSDESDPEVRTRMLTALPAFSSLSFHAVGEAIRSLGSKTKLEVTAARAALVAMGSKALSPLAKAFADPVRSAAAIEVVAIIGGSDADARRLLLETLFAGPAELHAVLIDGIHRVGMAGWEELLATLVEADDSTPAATRASFARAVANFPTATEGTSAPATAVLEATIAQLVAWTDAGGEFAVRFFATKALARFPGRAAVDALSLAALKDPEEVIRERAVQSLAEHEGERPAAVITAKLADGDARVRAAALRVVVEATAKHPGPRTEALDRTAKLLETDAWTFIRQKAAEVLGEMGEGGHLPPVAEAALLEATYDRRVAVAVKAMEALAEIGSASGRDRMIEILANEKLGANRRSGAALSLGKMKAKEAVAALVAVLEHHRMLSRASRLAEKIARHCAWALGQIGDTTARIPLEDCVVEGRTDKIRDDCAFALGELRDPCARELLEDAAANAPHARTKKIAAAALKKLADLPACSR